jgi:exosortase family protein XrtG
MVFAREVHVGSYLIFGLVSVAWAALLYFARRRRIWLLFYGLGAVGLSLLLVFAGTRLVPLEQGIEHLVARASHTVSGFIGIPTRVFQASPGNILVWVIVQEPGWTVVRVDLECSGLLEMAALAGLILFYPGWSLLRRIGLTLFGWFAVFGINIIRIVSIIVILHVAGKPAILIAHTIIGRLIFFVLIMALYWLVFSRLTLRTLSQRIRARMVA